MKLMLDNAIYRSLSYNNSFYKKFVKKDHVSCKKGNFLFFGANCSSARTYWHQKFWVPKRRQQKFEESCSKMQPLTQRRKQCKTKFILATRISIAECFYKKASGGTNCFVVMRKKLFKVEVNVVQLASNGWNTQVYVELPTQFGSRTSLYFTAFAPYQLFDSCFILPVQAS